MAEDIINNEEATDEKAENQEQETFSREDVLKLIQQESDKRVSQALKTQQKKYEKQLSLSQLDGDERAKAEKDNTIAELQAQLAQFTVEKNRSELKSVLSSRGLSAEFADLINISDDLEESQAKIDSLDKLFKKAVKAEIEKRLAGNAPKGNDNTDTQYTAKTIKKMSLSELTELEKINPEIYNKYFN